MNNTNYRVILALILLLGAFLRIYGLGDESFWLDESYTAEYTKYTIPQIIKGIYVNSTLLPQYFGKGAGAMPFYYILANTWTKLFGLSELKLRLISALFGILSIYLIFLVGKYLFNYPIGLISAFIFAINHQQISFSQEARMYSMLVALTLYSTFLLLNSLKTNKNIYWITFAIISVMLLYTHPLSFFILFFQGLFILIYWQNHKIFLKKMIYSGIAIFLSYLPWIPALFYQLSYGPPGGRVLGDPTLGKIFLILIQFNSWISPDINTAIALKTRNLALLSFSGWLLIISVLVIALLLGFAFLYSLIYSNKDKKFNLDSLKNYKIILLLIWFLIPIFIPFIISVIFPEYDIFSTIRYVLFASPAYYLIASLGIFKMNNWKSLFLIFLAVFSIMPLYSYYENFDNQQFREAVAFIVSSRSPNEFIFIHKSNIILPFSYYHSNLTNVFSVKDVDELKSYLNGKPQFWLLMSMEKFSDPNGTIMDYLDKNYIQIDKIEFVDIKVFKFTKVDNDFNNNKSIQ